jgi:hypothetical protein
LLPLKRLARKKSETVVPMSKIPSMFSKIEELHKINFHLLARLEVSRLHSALAHLVFALILILLCFSWPLFFFFFFFSS